MSVLEPPDLRMDPGMAKFNPLSRVRPHMDAALFGEIDMRVQIPLSKANLLTTQHRELIDSIQQETGVVISTLKDDAHDAVEPSTTSGETAGGTDELTPLTVHGQIDSVFEAFQRLESSVPDVIVSVVASFQVRNKRDIAGIIGTRGSTVSRLEQATKCHISTPPKHDPSRVITVHGESGQQVLSCLEMLSHELSRILHPHRSVLASFMHPFMPSPAPPPPQQQQQPGSAPVPSPPLPHHAHGGSMMGMGGMMPQYPMMGMGGMYPMAMMMGDPNAGQYYPTHAPMPQYPYHHMMQQHAEDQSKGYSTGPPPLQSFVYPTPAMPPYAVMPFGVPALAPQPPRSKRHSHPNLSHAGHVLADQHGDRSDVVSISMDFPPEKAGLVFGRGGKTLNNLKRETGTRIVVDAERGVIQIAATSMRAVQHARTAIHNILSSCESHRLIYYHSSLPGPKTVRFVRFHDPALTGAHDDMYVLHYVSQGPSQEPPLSPGMFQPSPESESSRASSPVPFSLEENELQLFVDMDTAQLQSQLHDCLQTLKPQMGQVELLCRFGKMVFTNIPEDLVGVPVPSDAVYNIIRTRQLHYTFEGGAGIPERVIERIVAQYRQQGVYSSRSVYYLSVLADIQAVGLDRRRRLDVILDRTVDPETGKPQIQFCGVREPYMKPFKADIIALQPDALDLRFAVRASPRPLAGEALAHVQQFASTIHAAGDLELEYPAKSPFRVTGCALKTVQTIHVTASNLVLEVVQHEGQESHRRFEFTVTTKAVEDLLGEAGAGVAGASAGQAVWAPTEVVAQFDEVMQKAFGLSQELTSTSP